MNDTRITVTARDGKRYEFSAPYASKTGITWVKHCDGDYAGMTAPPETALIDAYVALRAELRHVDSYAFAEKVAARAEEAAVAISTDVIFEGIREAREEVSHE